MITVDVIGDDAVIARLESMPQNIRQRLRAVIAQKIIDLREGVKTAIALIFNSRGPLYKSIGAVMSETTNSVQGTVFSEGVVYARIHEYGGTTRPHVILPRRAAVLVFMGREGKLIFTRRVNHPGSRIPERSYMRSTLTKMRPEITAAIVEAVGEGVAS